jgi:ribosomal protein S12 methylthiotransferase accessory factor
MKSMEIIFEGGSKVSAIYKGHIIKTDQPTHSGGTNSAPTPFDLFLTSIGTCAGFYVLRFCQEHNISTKGIKLILTTQKNQKTKMITKIMIEIQLPPEFPQKYKEVIKKSAEVCAVKRHIQTPPVFDIYTKYMS